MMSTVVIYQGVEGWHWKRIADSGRILYEGGPFHRESAAWSDAKQANPDLGSRSFVHAEVRGNPSSDEPTAERGSQSSRREQ